MPAYQTASNLVAGQFTVFPQQSFGAPDAIWTHLIKEASRWRIFEAHW
jgi:hypothetical protein